MRVGKWRGGGSGIVEWWGGGFSEVGEWWGGGGIGK